MVKDILNYSEAMAQKEKDIIENPQFNQNRSTNEEIKQITQNNLPSRIWNILKENEQNEFNHNSNIGGAMDNFSPNISTNISQLNKTARVQHHMSILQRNFTKIRPIFKQLVGFLVEEGDNIEEEKTQNNQGNSDTLTENEQLHDEKIDMRNMLGFLNQNLYFDYLNIINIMKLKRLDFRDIYGIRNPELILTRENLMERVMLLITSYFWMGTELRFLKQMMEEGFEYIIDSEFWHGKALQLAIKFLPSDAPLVKHIMSTYQKYYSPSFEQIPEDIEVISEVQIIRPNKGIKSNKQCPCIKNIPRPSIVLAPLDLDQNNYYTPQNWKESEESEKSEINLSDYFQNLNKKWENSESFEKIKIMKNEENSTKPENNQNKSPEQKINRNEHMKIIARDQISHVKQMKSFEGSNNSKESKENIKVFQAFKMMANLKQSKTLDQIEKKKEILKSPVQKSISPKLKQIRKKGENIVQAKTEEAPIPSLHNIPTRIKTSQGNRKKLNKNTSNEESKLRKKIGPKERAHSRPKTSKGQRQQGNLLIKLLNCDYSYSLEWKTINMIWKL